MARSLPPIISDTLKKYGFGKEAVWDCHGVWVVYHNALEKIAVKAGIKFDAPVIVEANGREGCAAICVTGHLGDLTVWSIGEASPKNNKNSYCWAMAEKRAVDRVVLKLIGLHGEAYSEEESDDFKGRPAPLPAQDSPSTLFVNAALIDIAGMKTSDALTTWATVNKPHIEALADDLQEKIRNAYRRKFNSLKEAA